MCPSTLTQGAEDLQLVEAQVQSHGVARVVMQLVLQVADGGVLQEVLLSGGRLVAFVALVGFRDFPLVA
eukprot:9539058-Prorocentrum_lima.AAC.1